MTQGNNQELRKLANSIRFLSIDAVQRANSGHPGMPMGMADVATILFSEFLKFDAKNPKWLDRDRFVLSAGHGSMLLYSLFYLVGYGDISLDDLKDFRKIGSKTAGHPEYGELAAIETTTGPLGQGLANSVGLAMAEKMLQNRVGRDVINHKTYCIAGDGCLMEGISQEAISIAGHFKLNDLVVLWDDNSISIDGDVSLASSENMKLRFEACGWEVLKVDGHNFDEIRGALNAAQKSDKPVLIACKTKIGFGSPNKEGSEKSHGSPLGEDEIALTRKNLNWNYAPFEIPQEILNKWREFGQRSHEKYVAWQKNFDAQDFSKAYDIKRILSVEFPQDFKENLNQFKQEIAQEKPSLATRKSSQNALEFLTKNLEEIIGGSADLTGSVLTKTGSTQSIFADDFSGRYIHYGVREHGMAAVMNGIALHGGFVPYAGTFLVFSDYLKPAIRLSALMKQQVFYVFTHDSIGLGEDGPTHQPIEHLAMLRAIPNLNVFRPCDAAETIACYEEALKLKDSPSAFVFTRQKTPFLKNGNDDLCGKGGYVICEQENPDVVIIATGSEVEIAFETKEKLAGKNISARIISMPCVELFEKQSESYKNEILGGKNTLKVAIEAALMQGWNRYIGDDGIFVGMDSFGASGKAGDLFEHFKITSDEAVKKIVARLEKK